ncbi:MAG: hypothetical protein CMP59_05790 [Flavobacteriales bacterium]|nr:hypothetical protein [Flavobacteriales bacterium]|tara:strand:- start:355 stop:810 length:456 start_codon:yes stop_codon:yes gene_type:complete
MWQRIQTLYLFLAILLNVSLFFLDFAVIKVEDNTQSFGMYGLEGEGAYHTVILAVITTVNILLSLIVVLLFKKRQLQIKLSQLNLFTQAALVAAAFFLVDEGIRSLGITDSITFVYDAATFVSLIPMLFIYLAIRGIKKDEALIRAADRIR